MHSANLSFHEKLRLQELAVYNILDSPPEKEFDELTELAALIYGCPIAAITFIDDNRQWLKSKKGLQFSETPRAISFCTHTILQEEVMVVEDAKQDDRFSNNPIVTSDLNIRFYAGAPIISSSGAKLGSVCVLDREPKTLTAEKSRALTIISHQVSKLLELRLKNKIVQEQAATLVENEKKITQNNLINQEKERHHISRELHENFAQSLAAAKLYLELSKDSEESRIPFLKKGIESISKILDDIRNFSKAIIPTTFSKMDVVCSINNYIEEQKNKGYSNIIFQFDEAAKYFDYDLSLILFRIVQDQVENIKTHAQGTNICIKLTVKNDISLTIEDDGKGFNIADTEAGGGINNIITRIETLGGSMNIRSTINKGTQLRVNIPLTVLSATVCQ